MLAAPLTFANQDLALPLGSGCGGAEPAHTALNQLPPRQTVNVLHLINGEHFAGAERVQQHLGKQLDRFGYAAHFASLKPGRFDQLCELPANRLHAAPMQARWDLRAIDRVVELVAQTQSYLLHAHTPRTALIAAFAAHRLQLPWVYHVHSPTSRDSTRPLINRINTLVERFAITSCDLLITVSRSLRREMLKRGVPHSRLVAVPNGVAAIEPIRPAERMSQTDWKLGLIALMRPRKGVEMALQAMAQLKAAGMRVSLELIGGFETAEYDATVRQLINQLDLHDCVQLSGFTKDIAAAIGRLDALVLPSLFGEGMPMVVLEALSAGVPVVATRVEGTPEVIRHGIEGLLARPRSADDLAEQIRNLCSSRSQWAAMSQAALQRHRQHFSDLEMARRVAKAYDRIV